MYDEEENVLREEGEEFKEDENDLEPPEGMGEFGLDEEDPEDKYH